MIEFRVAAIGTPEFPLEPSLESLPALAGVSGAMTRLRAEVLRAAVGEGTVVVHGEPGSGKSLAARALHEQGPRASRACAVVPCHTLPERLLELELFGGTSSATGRRPGMIESAQGGTVILENVELIGGRARDLLESFLATGSVDAESPGPVTFVDTRIILTSSRFGRVQAHSPRRSDPAWWERFAGAVVQVPTLRERADDIPLLLHLFAATAVSGRQVRFSREALAALQSYSWPGNVSQLRTVVERLAASVPGDEIRAMDLPVGIRPRRPTGSQVRRPSVGEELFARLQVSGESFWSTVYPLFMKREITRTDLRDLMRRALQRARGNAEDLVGVLNMPSSDRQRFARFLRKYDCELHPEL